MSRHLDSSTTTRMAKIMVQYGRPSGSFRAKSVLSPFGRTVMEKAIWENPIAAGLGEGFQLWMLIRTPWKGVVPFLCMRMTSNWLKRKKILVRCGKYSTKKAIWENQHLSLIMKTWDVLKDNVKLAKILLTITEPCLDHEFPRGELKNYQTRKIFVFLRGLTIWKVMPRNVWNGIVSWRTRRFNNSTKYLLHASMTIISKRKKQNLLENCQMYPLKLFWNAYNWHVLKDLIFYGQWTNLHDPLQNGPKPVTNDYVVWSLTSITHVNTNSTVMWVIL